MNAPVFAQIALRFAALEAEAAVLARSCARARSACDRCAHGGSTAPRRLVSVRARRRPARCASGTGSPARGGAKFDACLKSATSALHPGEPQQAPRPAAGQRDASALARIGGTRFESACPHDESPRAAVASAACAARTGRQPRQSRRMLPMQRIERRAPPRAVAFQATVDGRLCVADYRLSNGVMHMTHTAVPARVAKARHRRGDRAGGARARALAASCVSIRCAATWPATCSATPRRRICAREPRPRADDVLAFWFGEPGSPEHGRPLEKWFRKDAPSTEQIAERYGALIESALAGELRAWAREPGLRWRRSSCSISSRAMCFAIRRVPSPATRARSQRRVRSSRAGATKRCCRYSARSPTCRSSMPKTWLRRDEGVQLTCRLAAVAPDMGDALDWARRHQARHRALRPLSASQRGAGSRVDGRRDRVPAAARLALLNAARDRSTARHQRQQLCGVDRLHQVRVEAGLLAAAAIGILAVAGERDQAAAVVPGACAAARPSS